MSETNQQPENQDSQTKYTPEQLKAMREKMHDFYKEELPTLRKQEEYEKLQANIEEHKTRGIMAQAKLAQFYSQMEAMQNAAEAEANAQPGVKTPADPEPEIKPEMKVERND